MYENLYTYSESFLGKYINVLIKPNFREAISTHDGKNVFLTDGKISMKGKLVLASTRSEYPNVYVSEDAQWVLEEDGNFFTLYITERTKEIKTGLSSAWDKKFNWLLKKCKAQYAQKKREEIRLYFYDSQHKNISLFVPYSYCNHNNLTKYNLSLTFHPHCALDRACSYPKKDCFILGRITRTIGTKDLKLMDFIEPVYTISLDFDNKDELFYGDYDTNKEQFAIVICELLEFCILKEHRKDNVKYFRIATYLEKAGKKDIDIISEFSKEILEAFKNGKPSKLRQLYHVFTSEQNCKGVNFKIKLEKEIFCSPNKNIMCYFENREEIPFSAQWVFDNIENCTDASASFLELRNEINFY